MRTLTALPERYALALEAKYGDGLSVEQIAGQLGVTATAAQSLLARARDAFRDYWRRTEERDTAVGKCYD
jgi:DNA-directed RNA polymerase specialized sigma24 family protein